MKGLLIFAAGLVAGAVAGAYLVKDKVMADANEEIREVREYYRSKKEDTKEEQPKVEEEPKVEEKEEKEEYKEITRNYINYNEPNVQESKVDANDTPYIIDPEEFGELKGYDTETYTYFADGVLVDDVDDVIDDPDPIIGLENLKVFEEFTGCSAIYVRNDIWKMDFEILKDDWKWSDIQDGPAPETVVEKKPHQL